MTDFGFKVSSSGNDVKTTAKSDLLSYSEGLSFKSFMRGTTTLTLDGSGNGTKTIAHNLGFSPSFLVYVKDTARHPLNQTTVSNCYFSIPGYGNAWSTLNDYDAYSDATNLTIQVFGGVASQVVTLYYNIFIDLGTSFTGNIYKGTQDFGMKVAKEKVSTDDNDYSLTMISSYPPLKHKKGNMGTRTLHLNAFTAPVNSYQVMYYDIYHGLGYTPLFLSYIVSGTNSYLMPYVLLNSVETPYVWYEAFADNTRLRLSVTRCTLTIPTDARTFGAEDVTFKYIIFSEPLE